MAKNRSVYRYWRACLALLLAGAAALAFGQANGPASASASAPAPRWIDVARDAGHLTAADIGLVINTADPYSEEVGRYYETQRHLRPSQVLRVEIPVKGRLDLEEFARLQNAIGDHFGPHVQALALAWRQPYAVLCNSITGAIALGVDSELCKHTCERSRASAYFNNPTARPFTDLGFRPAMLLAAPDEAAARAMIDRGVASDHTLGLRGSPPAEAHFAWTPDAARNVRARLYPPSGRLAGKNVMVFVDGPEPPHDRSRVLLLQTGVARLPPLDTIQFVPGALADHLTSFGGQLDQRGGQSTALDWIAAGATASYGTVTEPCNHPQKFPHPQVLLLHFLQGVTALEAYWKSVGWPQQGVFVGEPLAAPFAR